MSDPLSEILRLVEVWAGVSGRLRAGGAWSLAFPAPADVKFNAVVTGCCWLDARSLDAPIRLEAGDCVLLTAPQPYVLASDPTIPSSPAGPVFSQAVGGLAVAGSGDGTLLIGGQLGFNPSAASLILDGLPDIVVVRQESVERGQLHWLLTRLVDEIAADAPGGALLADQLAQLLAVTLLRSHFAAGGAGMPGWLRGMADTRIAKAIAAVLAEPARAWTVGALAGEAGMSRSTFSARFSELVATAPMAFVQEWRLQSAARLLRSGRGSIGAIAAQVGYGSESALGAAFGRRFGSAPAAYRHRSTEVGEVGGRVSTRSPT
ncbi:AraC family transcriptional regulator [Sphingomonas sp. DT-51]|uniref:AraC family transcriptional regulator n=1 Tax=Sphingomonas sp. DT-51 TaxID=3396165 RepID=UPI003F1BC807